MAFKLADPRQIQSWILLLIVHHFNVSSSVLWGPRDGADHWGPVPEMQALRQQRLHPSMDQNACALHRDSTLRPRAGAELWPFPQGLGQTAHHSSAAPLRNPRPSLLAPERIRESLHPRQEIPAVPEREGWCGPFSWILPDSQTKSLQKCPERARGPGHEARQQDTHRRLPRSQL